MDRECVRFYRENGYLKFPKIMQIEITNRCPLNCHQCYKDIENLKDIDFSLLEKTIISAAAKGLKNVMINGGEPLIYYRFFDFLDLLKEYGISSNCYISGYGVTDKLAFDLQKYDITINVSLNGSSKEINTLSRDGYTHAIKAIQTLSRNNSKFGINWVARQDNIEDFENMLMLAEQYSAQSLLVIGNKMTHLGNLDSPLNRTGLFKLVSMIREYEASSGKVVIEKQRCFTDLCSAYYNTYNSIHLGCPAGVVMCTMNLEGKFSPCSHLHHLEEYDSADEYWHSSKILHSLRNCNISDESICSTCKHNNKCKFCKAVSERTHEDFNAGKTDCNIVEKVVKIYG